VNVSTQAMNLKGTDRLSFIKAFNTSFVSILLFVWPCLSLFVTFINLFEKGIEVDQYPMVRLATYAFAVALCAVLVLAAVEESAPVCTNLPLTYLNSSSHHITLLAHSYACHLSN
jgi:hypothetical protein